MSQSNTIVDDKLNEIRDIYTDLIFEMDIDQIIDHLDTVTNGYVTQRNPNDKESYICTCSHIDLSLHFSQLIKKFFIKIDKAIEKQ